jgi:cytochrome b subunit of formate dehydrogenase
MVAAMHLVSLMVSRRLRLHWQTLWPRRNDLPETLGGFLYNLGLLRHKPKISPYSYIEKMEYWAVVWGGVVMALTGLMLWANNVTLAWLPKSAIDFATAVHFYEAVLATLAIFVWHFYTVIFDPDVYPLETAFLTGVSVKLHPPEQPPSRPDETATLGQESNDHASAEP